MSACREVRPYVEPYVDGELEAAQVAMVEQHLQGCELCHGRVRLDEAVRVSVRRSVQDSVEVAGDFESRVRAALVAEAARELGEEKHKRQRPLGWGAVIPLATAAALALAFGVWRQGGSQSKLLASVPPVAGHQEATLDPMGTQDIAGRIEAALEQLVENHASAAAPQFTQLSMVRQLEPEVGVPLRPPSLQDYGAHFLGGSMVPLRGRQAASFSYGASDGHRLTVYVYDAKRVPLRTALEARVVNNAPVYVGFRRGYSIAAVERRGVGYALAADMDDRESAEMIVRSVH